MLCCTFKFICHWWRAHVWFHPIGLLLLFLQNLRKLKALVYIQVYPSMMKISCPIPINRRDTPFPTTPRFPSYRPTSPPTKPLHSENEYDTATDFAEWDDFFESKALHNLEDILDDYSVIISYSGSRFYGTMVEPNATFDDIFPQDYHAFWSQSFDVNRTFIISDTTFASNPVAVDFFEMRRRINSVRNPNVQFSFGPFGALIPLMNYEGTGFFHCLRETSHPSSSPSSSGVPTTSVSPSQIPSGWWQKWMHGSDWLRRWRLSGTPIPEMKLFFHLLTSLFPSQELPFSTITI